MSIKTIFLLSSEWKKLYLETWLKTVGIWLKIKVIGKLMEGGCVILLTFLGHIYFPTGMFKCQRNNVNWNTCFICSVWFNSENTWPLVTVRNNITSLRMLKIKQESLCGKTSSSVLEYVTSLWKDSVIYSIKKNKNK